MRRVLLFLSFLVLSVGCKKEAPSPQMLHFAICADYPPFEYVRGGDFVGFEVDIARRVAESLGCVPIFHDMSFASILPTLKNGFADVAISAITSTAKRRAECDMSDNYFQEVLYTMFDMFSRVEGKEALEGKKVACQLGSTMEFWVKENVPSAKILTVDTLTQAIEMLKAGHVAAVVLDGPQAKEFCAQNKALLYAFLAESEEGYAIAMKKGSPLKAPINEALRKLKEDGTIRELLKKWKLDESH
jgi:polar amino acid transport system substrate-binding protein